MIRFRSISFTACFVIFFEPAQARTIHHGVDVVNRVDRVSRCGRACTRRSIRAERVTYESICGVYTRRLDTHGMPPHLALFHDRDVGVGRRQPRVWHDVFRLFEPPRGGLVEHRAFEGDGSEVAVERGLAVRGDGDHVVVDDVRVAHLTRRAASRDSSSASTQICHQTSMLFFHNLFIPGHEISMVFFPPRRRRSQSNRGRRTGSGGWMTWGWTRMLRGARECSKREDVRLRGAGRLGGRERNGWRLLPASYLFPTLRFEEVTQLSRAAIAASLCLPSVEASTPAPPAAPRVTTVVARAHRLVDDPRGRDDPADGVAMLARAVAIWIVIAPKKSAAPGAMRRGDAFSENEQRFANP